MLNAHLVINSCLRLKYVKINMLPSAIGISNTLTVVKARPNPATAFELLF